MIDPIGRSEYHIVVAVFTDIGCLDVSWVLADRLPAVMAGDAAIHNTRMVERRRYPAERRMAIVTRVAACYVCRVLTCSDVSVVTG